MDNGFSIGGKEYKLRKLDAFKQFHIVRRIGPIMADLLPALQGDHSALTDEKKLAALPEEQKLALIAKVANPIMLGMAKLSKEDSEEVLMGLLGAVEVKQSTGNWASVAVDKLLMIQDMDLKLMLNLAGRAFMFNIAGFFGELPR